MFDNFTWFDNIQPAREFQAPRLFGTLYIVWVYPNLIVINLKQLNLTNISTSF